MTEITGDITGGDYASAGRASKALKTALKRIGADAAVVRRAMVAAYEAEMNVVIHAHEGALRAAVTPDALEVEVSDTGPGIADIAQALREGYSTASPEARDLGFGAGMGLPNIRRNTDRFSIHSEVGKGTRLQFTIFLAAQHGAEVYTASVSVDPEKCKCCLRCLHVCPTQAIRLRNNAPIILPHLCIGCTACRTVCPEGVYGIECPDELPAPTPDTTLFLPAPLRGQFGAHISEEMFRKALTSLGWDNVWFSDPWEHALATAVEEYARDKQTHAPVLPPVCPAVVNLIQVRYPSLLGNVPPLLNAIESAHESLNRKQGLFLIPCAALCTLACASSVLRPCDAVSPGGLLRSLSTLRRCPPVDYLSSFKGCREVSAYPAKDGGESVSTTVTITGIERVCQFLDEAENGRVNDCGIVELWACDSGCFGSPVWPEHPEVSRYRSTTPDAPKKNNSRCGAGFQPASPSSMSAEQPAAALYRPKPLEARAGVRLDPDMGKAIAKLAQISSIRATLPGRDCAVCGSPSCLALAEDIVMGRASANACVYKNSNFDDR